MSRMKKKQTITHKVKIRGKRRTTKKNDLTKTMLETAARKGIQEAAVETMAIMGHNVIARNGWIGKLFRNGKFERISPIPQVTETK